MHNMMHTRSTSLGNSRLIKIAPRTARVGSKAARLLASRVRQNEGPTLLPSQRPPRKLSRLPREVLSLDRELLRREEPLRKSTVRLLSRKPCNHPCQICRVNVDATNTTK